MNQRITSGQQLEQKYLLRPSFRSPNEVPYQSFWPSRRTHNRQEDSAFRLEPRITAERSAMQFLLFQQLRRLIRSARAQNRRCIFPNSFSTSPPTRASGFDLWHGVDAFIEWSEVIDGRRLAFALCIDLTRNLSGSVPAPDWSKRTPEGGFRSDRQRLWALGPTRGAGKKLMLRLLLDRRQMLVNPTLWHQQIRLEFLKYGHSWADAEAYLARVRRSATPSNSTGPADRFLHRRAHRFALLRRFRAQELCFEPVTRASVSSCQRSHFFVLHTIIVQCGVRVRRFHLIKTSQATDTTPGSPATGFAASAISPAD